MRNLGLFLAVISVCAGQSVEDVYRERARKIIAAAMQDEGGMAKLSYLCDRIGHRLSAMLALVNGS